MISINDLVWSEENDNEKIANAIPINCMAYNCTYNPVPLFSESGGERCSHVVIPLLSASKGEYCNLL